MDGLRQDRQVVRIPKDEIHEWRARDDDSLGPKESTDVFRCVARHLEFRSEDPVEFTQDGLAENQLMVGEDQVQDIGTETPSGEGTDENVRVESDSHDTSRKMSSSVRYPWASAKGRTRRLRSSNLVSANWRRRASRTTSLRLRPELSAARSSSLSSSGSSRIVTVEVFM